MKDDTLPFKCKCTQTLNLIYFLHWIKNRNQNVVNVHLTVHFKLFYDGEGIYSIKKIFCSNLRSLFKFYLLNRTDKDYYFKYYLFLVVCVKGIPCIHCSVCKWKPVESESAVKIGKIDETDFWTFQNGSINLLTW